MVDVAQPLALILLLPATLGWFWLSRRAAEGAKQLPGTWSRIIAKPLRSFVAKTTAGGHGMPRVLLGSLWLLLVLALARPGIQFDDQPVYANLTGRAIVLDLGGEASIHDQRLSVMNLVESSPDVPTALIVATADAFDVVPLTTDRAFIERYINVIKRDVMPAQGRAPSLAMIRGEALLTQAGVATGQVVLISAGMPPEQPAGSRTWLRSIIVPEDDTPAWRSFAKDSDARLTSAQNISSIVSDLQEDIETASRTSVDTAHHDLTPYLLASAALLWLGLFRRRRAA